MLDKEQKPEQTTNTERNVINGHETRLSNMHKRKKMHRISRLNVWKKNLHVH